MFTKTDAEARVARGADYLDTIRPGWFNEIETGTLMLSSYCRCIMGQLAGERGWASVDFEIAWSADRAIALGFLRGGPLFDHRSEYAVLQDAWIAAIAARRHPVADEKDNERFESATPTNAVREETDSPLVSIRASSSSSSTVLSPPGRARETAE